MNPDAIDRSEEDAWARRARGGDRAAMEQLLGALYDQVRAVCCRVCANDADGEDATQNALIAIVRAVPNFDGRSAVRTWAHRIAYNAALDEVRRRGRRASSIDVSASDHPIDRIAPTPDEPGLDERLADHLDIDAALTRLPVDYRAAVVLRDVIGMDYAEIATTLDIPVGTVRSRIARGRRSLARDLGLPDTPASPTTGPATTTGNQSDVPVVSSEER